MVPSRPMLEAVRVVLSRPRDPRNIGAVCRAMKTMGLTRLHVAGALPAELPEARILAVHALDVLEGMVRHPTLEDAVRGCALVVVKFSGFIYDTNGNLIKDTRGPRSSR